ncbi:hypothetical protein PHJA_001095100 [Phtheirospermum japonicum]|uniref:BED-type domain-containing protein n=1 Tax=Phtheirospermum japonicum TaxID=374723 RepID=A0A830C2A3_9LAMI|nr:hypothetical protein PHJA_001095100 [Phtheirospermum japonicum]
MSSHGGSSRSRRSDKGKSIALDDDANVHPIGLSQGNTPSVGDYNPNRIEIDEDWSDTDIDRCYRAAAAFAGEDVPPIEEEDELPPPRNPRTRSRATTELKSDIFKKHFQKIEIPPPANEPQPEDGKKRKRRYRVTCNYCTSSYQFLEGGGYGNMHNHLNNKHPDKVGIDRTQTQLQGGQQRVGKMDEYGTPRTTAFRISSPIDWVNHSIDWSLSKSTGETESLWNVFGAKAVDRPLLSRSTDSGWRFPPKPNRRFEPPEHMYISKRGVDFRGSINIGEPSILKAIPRGKNSMSIDSPGEEED